MAKNLHEVHNFRIVGNPEVMTRRLPTSEWPVTRAQFHEAPVKRMRRGHFNKYPTIHPGGSERQFPSGRQLIRNLACQFPPQFLDRNRIVRKSETFDDGYNVLKNATRSSLSRWERLRLKRVS